MQAYRLRVELPDRPGSLAALGGVLAGLGANIVSVDIQVAGRTSEGTETDVDAGGPTAIDDIVVRVPDGWEPGRLSAALADDGTAVLLSAQRLTADPDAVLATLRSCVSLLQAEPADRDAACEAALLALAPGSLVWVTRADEAGEVDAGRLALAHRESTILRSDDIGGRTSEAPVGWVLAALDDRGEPGTVAFVARPEHVRFSATEVERVEALLRLRRLLG